MTKAERIKNSLLAAKERRKHQKSVVYQKGNAEERIGTTLKQFSTAGLAGSNACGAESPSLQ